MKVQHFLLSRTFSLLVSLFFLHGTGDYECFNKTWLGSVIFITELLYTVAGFGVGHMRDTKTKG